MKMEVIYFSETSVYFQWTAWRFIPEDSTFITTAVRSREEQGLTMTENEVLQSIFEPKIEVTGRG
jgi:hypothetical protein